MSVRASPGGRWKKLKTAMNFSSKMQAARMAAAPDMLGESMKLYSVHPVDEGAHQGGRGGGTSCGDSAGALNERLPEKDRIQTAVATGPSPSIVSPGSDAPGPPSKEATFLRQSSLDSCSSGDSGQAPALPALRQHSLPRGVSISPMSVPGALGDGAELLGDVLEGGREGVGVHGIRETQERRPGQFRPRGRKGVEDLRVNYDMKLYCWISDFYITALKMPSIPFVLCVFAAPLLLSLVFTPLYLVGVSGLRFGGGALLTLAETAAERGSDVTVLCCCRWAASIVLQVFLHSVSLSTTFGGSPVSAQSLYTLILGNMNCMVAQFLLVFLTGAVFARLSQPVNPVRCAKRAIIRQDDYVPKGTGPEHSLTPGWVAPAPDESGEQVRVFATRLVLAGPAPRELVDVKVRLTFRCFLHQKHGTIFTNQDLPLVRSEAPHLQYGMTVRHIIDQTSPVYEHNMETLMAGDACFALSVFGTDWSSMQPVFHLQEYYVHDGDVVWGADFQDAISVDSKGQRILHHAKTDLLKSFKAGAIAAQAITKLTLASKHGEKQQPVGTSPTWQSSFGLWQSLQSWRTSLQSLLGKQGKVLLVTETSQTSPASRKWTQVLTKAQEKKKGA